MYRGTNTDVCQGERHLPKAKQCKRQQSPSQAKAEAAWAPGSVQSGS